MDKQRNERTPHKHFRYGFEDNLIAKCTEPPKDNNKRRNKFRFNERVDCVSQKESDNGDNYNNQKIYAYMEQISGNCKIPSRDFVDSLKLTNWVLNSGTECNMTPQVC